MGLTPAPSLLLFARAPEPGHVETRLSPAFGAAGTAPLGRVAFREEFSTGAWAAAAGGSDHPAEDLETLGADFESRDPAAPDFPSATAAVLRGLAARILA